MYLIETKFFAVVAKIQKTFHMLFDLGYVYFSLVSSRQFPIINLIIFWQNTKFRSQLLLINYLSH